MTAPPRPFTGVIAAPVLPMLPDSAVDWLTLRSYIRWVAGQRPAGIAMNMDASEAVALSWEEQDEVIRWLDRAGRAARPSAAQGRGARADPLPADADLSRHAATCRDGL